MSSVASFGRLVGVAAVALLGGAVGCVPATKSLQTNHFTLNHPDFWQVKQTASKDGEPSIVVIPQYGAAVIDQGSGAMSSPGANYDAVTADIEARLYNFRDPAPQADPTRVVGNLLAQAQPDLAIEGSFFIPDNPPECGVYPKKFTIFGNVQTPIEIVRRPGYRSIIVGGRSGGVLTAVVARFEYTPDMARNCHNLRNLRVQLQNLLDGLSPSAPVAAGPVAPPGTPSPAAGAETAPKQ